MWLSICQASIVAAHSDFFDFRAPSFEDFDLAARPGGALLELFVAALAVLVDFACFLDFVFAFTLRTDRASHGSVPSAAEAWRHSCSYISCVWT